MLTQHVPVELPHNPCVQLVSGPCHSPPTLSHADKVRKVQEVPTQHAPVWAQAPPPIASTEMRARTRRTGWWKTLLMLTLMLLL